VAGEVLHVAQPDRGIQGQCDRRVPQAVRRDAPGDADLAAQRLDEVGDV
jgi:hypothetical protein